MAEPRDWQGAERDPAEAARLAALYDLDTAPLEGGPDVEWFSGLARRTGGPIPELGCGTRRITVPRAPGECRDPLGRGRHASVLLQRGVRPRLRRPQLVPHARPERSLVMPGTSARAPRTARSRRDRRVPTRSGGRGRP